MTNLAIFFTIWAVIGGALLIWFNTKSGKKWLNDL